jgi:1,4-dihydroxy-2-naphthoyl-CoA hydrolase
MIWFKKYSIEELSKNVSHPHMGNFLGIEMLEIGDDFLSARMPVDDRTKQPFGLLHGGASCVLAETLGSFASYLCVDGSKQRTVGLEINANHIKSMKFGFVLGVARPIHLGKKTHVWDIRLCDQDSGVLVCVSRLTVAVLDN